MKLIIQRFINTWIEDTYDVDEINEEVIDKAINYDIDPTKTEILWDTVEDTDVIDVFDENYNVLRKKGKI